MEDISRKDRASCASKYLILDSFKVEMITWFTSDQVSLLSTEISGPFTTKNRVVSSPKPRRDEDPFESLLEGGLEFIVEAERSNWVEYTYRAWWLGGWGAWADWKKMVGVVENHQEKNMVFETSNRHILRWWVFGVLNHRNETLKHSGNSDIAMENGPGLKMYLLVKIVMFHCHVGLLEGNI